MLTEIKDMTIINNNLDFLKSLVKQNQYSSFPLFNDGVKGFDTYIQWLKDSFDRENERVFLYFENDSLKGVIHYHFLTEDLVVGLSSMIIKDSFDRALEALIEHWHLNYPNYKYTIYLPSQNQKGIDLMKKLEYPLRSQERVNMLLHQDMKHRDCNGGISINKDNFELFSNLHSKFEQNMYYISSKILESLDSWIIYFNTYSNDSGCIYAKVYNINHIEVFGLDINSDNTELVSNLAQNLINECINRDIQSITFFANEFVSNTIEKLGFQKITTALEYGN